MREVCDLRTKKEKRIRFKYEDNHKFINGIEYKLCSKCVEWHPMNGEWFYNNKSSPDGFNPYCKEATKEKSTIFLKENKDKRANYNHKYHQKQESKENEKVRKRRYRKEGKRKGWEDGNKDKIIKYTIKYKKNKEHEISNQEWKACKEYFNNNCSYCGMTEKEHKEKYNQQLHKEHAINKGLNDLSNCVPACKECNSEKHDKDFDQWYNEENKNYLRDRLDKINKWLNEDYKPYIQPSKPKQKYTKRHKKWFK